MFSWLAPKCVAAPDLLGDLAHHDRMVVAEQQRAVADHEVYVAVAVEVPLVSAVGMVHVDRERLVNALVVLDSVRKNAPGALVHLEALRAFLLEEALDSQRGLYFGSRHVMYPQPPPRGKSGPGCGGAFIILSRGSYHSYVGWIKAAR